MSDNITFPVSSAAVDLLVKKQDSSANIYDPKLRTPTTFKAPEIEMCPHCGQQMPSKVRQLNTAMNTYINGIGIKVAVMESADTLDIKGVTYYRVTSQVGDESYSKFMPQPEWDKSVASNVSPTPTPTPSSGVDTSATPVVTTIPAQTLAEKVAASAAQHTAQQ
jgi:hypothetical protein